MQFDTPKVQASLLVGSFSRGEAGPYSDIDLLRLGSVAWCRQPSLAKPLVNVSDADMKTVEAWFTNPEKAVGVVGGLQQARILLEKDGAAKALLERAQAFVWTFELQHEADVWASAQLVGWAEEAHKGLAGLDSGNTGQLLHAQFGLPWSLAKTVRVQRGLLSGGDNAFLAELQKEFAGTRWLKFLHGAYGLTGFAPADQVRAGLEALLPHRRPIERRVTTS